MMKHFFLAQSILFTLLAACSSDKNYVKPLASQMATENVVLVVIDGPRLSETWGDSLRVNIPHQNKLSSQGVLFNNFMNDGVTFTLSGHSAITTGYYDLVINNGSELPDQVSIFQRYLEAHRLPPTEAWIITSKKKLAALSDCKDLDWRGSYRPSINTVDREDEITMQVAIDTISTYKPSLTMIHFRGPDSRGHSNDWNGYIKAIQETDFYVKQIWDYIQGDAHYRDKTTLLVTADHGRHSSGIGSSFVGHGDSCDGCRQISLLAIGPDLEKGVVVQKPYGQIDIAPTIASMLNIDWAGEGNTIEELIK
ncbi:alkaline phosphatase [Fulvivirga sp. RKSG066]|uniref:alkaline phosphatase n=1 Tax=Fulvivirga aurantia TaxID=2529383 RepID=UPI0012BC4FC6|nr:alkaline phosphatase [Fulvivirga aurantia]MTI21035.1 alkaline phosphatase [Fulvivirga aurantia]